MRNLVYKLIALLAIVGAGVPTAQAQAQEQANVLPVVSLLPEDHTPRIGRNALVAIRMVDRESLVHKIHYFTSYNTVDITLAQVVDQLKKTYDIEEIPQNIQTDTHLKHYVTDQDEFYGIYLQADVVLKNAEAVPIETVAEPTTYPVTVLENKISDLFYEQLATVEVKDQAGQVLSTTHYVMNSDSQVSPVEVAADSFVKDHPNYQVNTQEVQQEGSVDRNKLEELATSLGTIQVFRSHYVLTATQLVISSMETEGLNQSLMSQPASQESESSQQERVNGSQATVNLSHLPKVESQLAKSASQPVKVATTGLTTSPVSQSVLSGKVLPDTGEVATATLLALGLAFTAVGVLLVHSYRQYTK